MRDCKDYIHHVSIQPFCIKKPRVKFTAIKLVIEDYIITDNVATSENDFPKESAFGCFLLHQQSLANDSIDENSFTIHSMGLIAYKFSNFVTQSTLLYPHMLDMKTHLQNTSSDSLSKSLQVILDAIFMHHPIFVSSMRFSKEKIPLAIRQQTQLILGRHQLGPVNASC